MRSLICEGAIRIEKSVLKRVKCPFCGYLMPVSYAKDATCRGIYVRCKGRQCKKVFEIKLDK